MTVQQLVPTFTGELAGISQPLVNSNDLWTNLSVSTPHHKWISRRIEEYGFTEGEDFCTTLCKTSFLGRPRTEYHLSLEMAKELALLENNAIGRQIRRQLIALERNVPGVIRKLESELVAARAEALSARPVWQMIIRYRNLTLSQGEICKLLDLSDTSLRKHLKRMAEIGLVDWRVDPHRSQLGRKSQANLQGQLVLSGVQDEMAGGAQ